MEASGASAGPIRLLAAVRWSAPRGRARSAVTLNDEQGRIACDRLPEGRRFRVNRAGLNFGDSLRKLVQRQAQLADRKIEMFTREPFRFDCLTSSCVPFGGF